MIAIIKNKRDSLSFVLMFKKIIALVFLVTFVAQTFSAPFIILDYYANTSAYAKNCINKAKPTMHCNGKCQVMKKLREEEKKEQENNERRTTLKFEILSTKSFYPIVAVPEPFNIEPVRIIKPYLIALLKTSYDFFHPPRVTSA